MGKRDLIISWRYASLAMNRGAIKQGVIVLNCSYYEVQFQGKQVFRILLNNGTS
jgi:hypothetical protein